MVRVDNRFEQIDRAALHNALLSMHTCPRCRADLQPVAFAEDVWGCADCRETWHLPKTTYVIESRWPSWARWRVVTARPHGERFPFDPQTHALTFQTTSEAEAAAAALAKSNAGEYRVRETQ